MTSEARRSKVLFNLAVIFAHCALINYFEAFPFSRCSRAVARVRRKNFASSKRRRRKAQKNWPRKFAGSTISRRENLGDRETRGIESSSRVELFTGLSIHPSIYPSARWNAYRRAKTGRNDARALRFRLVLRRINSAVDTRYRSIRGYPYQTGSPGTLGRLMGFSISFPPRFRARALFHTATRDSYCERARELRAHARWNFPRRRFGTEEQEGHYGFPISWMISRTKARNVARGSEREKERERERGYRYSPAVRNGKIIGRDTYASPDASWEYIREMRVRPGATLCTNALYAPRSC